MLYFRGCTAREKENSIQESTEKLLKLAGVDYHILDDEKYSFSTHFYKVSMLQVAIKNYIDMM